MGATIDLNKTVYDLIKENPELVNIMQKIGFKDITNPAMLSTAGRFMTIPKGAAMKKIDLVIIKETFEKKGYTVIQ